LQKFIEHLIMKICEIEKYVANYCHYVHNFNLLFISINKLYIFIVKIYNTDLLFILFSLV